MYPSENNPRQGRRNNAGGNAQNGGEVEAAQQDSDDEDDEPTAEDIDMEELFFTNVDDVSIKEHYHPLVQHLE